MDNIFAPSRSPVALLDQCLRNSWNEHKTAITELESGHHRKIRRLAQLFVPVAKLMAAFSESINNKSFSQPAVTEMVMQFKALELLLQRENIQLVYAPRGVISEETGRHFDVISAQPAAGIVEPQVEKTIDPAVFMEGKVLIRGMIHIIAPESYIATMRRNEETI